MIILKEAWEKRLEILNVAWAKHESLYDLAHICDTANNHYRWAVENFFGPDFVIHWDTGEVEGYPLPIPPSELGL